MMDKNATLSPEPETRLEQEANGNGSIQENEIRVTAQGKMRNYVTYATSLFSESKSHTVVLKGMGRVINKTVSLAEILKRRVKGLYQFAEIGSIKVVDKKTKKDEEETEVVRLLSVIKIVLTTEPENKAKYQPPIDEAAVEPMLSIPQRGKGNRNRSKPKKTKANEPVPTEEKAEAKADPKRMKRRRNRRPKKDDPKAKTEGEASAQQSDANITPDIEVVEVTEA